MTRREFLQAVPAGLSLPWLLRAAGAAPDRENPMPATGSDLGSLFPFLSTLERRGEPRLSFVRDEFTDVAGWRRQAAGRVRELMHYDPPHCTPDAQVLSRVDRGDFIEEHLTFRTTPDLRVPATVLIPKNAKLPAPGIVALHDHGAFYLWGREKVVASDNEHPSLTEFKRTAYGGKSYANELVRQGYVVIAIDMFYWGERRLLLDDDPADWRDRPAEMPNERVLAYHQRSGQYCDLVGRSIMSTGATWYGIMTTDDIRTVDYLASRPEVDANRLGCVGLSVGGFRSGQLAALDERIKCAVVVGWMCSFPPQLQVKIKNTLGWMMTVPGLYGDLDYPDIVSMTAPRALMVVNGSQDGLFDPDGVKGCFGKLGRIWRKAGVPEKINCRLFDEPHEFSVQAQAEAWEWLKRWV